MTRVDLRSQTIHIITNTHFNKNKKQKNKKTKKTNKDKNKRNLKILRGSEVRYPKFDKLAMTVVHMSRKLHHYF